MARLRLRRGPGGLPEELTHDEFFNYAYAIF